MFEISDTVLIKSTPEKAFSKLVYYFENSGQYKEWHDDHISCKWEKGSAFSQASVLLAREYLHGKRHSLRFRILRAVANKKIEYKLLFPYSLVGCSGYFSFTKQGDGTVFRAGIRLGISEAFKRMFSRHLESISVHMKEEGASLKSALEAEEVCSSY